MVICYGITTRTTRYGILAETEIQKLNVGNWEMEIPNISTHNSDDQTFAHQNIYLRIYIFNDNLNYLHEIV